MRQRRGFIATISFYGAVSYFYGPAYGSRKAATDKMMHDMPVDLASHDVAAVSLWPARVRTEMAVRRRQGKPDGEERLAQYETPRFSGLVIDALLHDATLMQLSGQTIIAAEYARDWHIRGVDGKQPVSLRETMGAPLCFSDSSGNNLGHGGDAGTGSNNHGRGTDTPDQQHAKRLG